MRVAQAQENQPGPSPLLPTFTAFAGVSSSQTSVTESSAADSSVTAPTANVEPNPSETTLLEVPASPGFPDGPAATPLLTTIESPQTPTDTAVAEATQTTASDSPVAAAPNLNSNAVQSTVAVAGGVIGGVVAVSILAFFIWWWRRRLLRKRRSTLLTPLDIVPSFDRDEKGGYVITRGSIGPTPMTEKVKAALGQNFRKIRGHIRNKTAPSVNLDRGPSQFIDPASAPSRMNSVSRGGEATAKDSLKGWWSRVMGGMSFNWRARNNKAEADSGMNARGLQEKKTGVGSQPDFLTLLNMDNRELDREAQRRRASLSRINGSGSSTDRFLGGLDLNFSSASDNPFSDANAIAHTSAKPAPLAVGNNNTSTNPFSDANAIPGPSLPSSSATTAGIPKPATYISTIRRSRGQSVGGASTVRQPSTAYYTRDSVGSVATVTTTNQRNKFRSDPFDLERPELLLSGGPAGMRKSSVTSSTAGTAGSITEVNPNPEPRRPMGAMTRATRAESFTSKYSSGISVASLGDWSDPGPDVGPGASGGSGVGDKRVSPMQAWRERVEREQQAGSGNGNGSGRRTSGGSQGSVGKAM